MRAARLSVCVCGRRGSARLPRWLLALLALVLGSVLGSVLMLLLLILGYLAEFDPGSGSGSASVGDAAGSYP